MAVLAEVGTLVCPASTGNQTVSLDPAIWGGEAPKCVIFWGSRATDAIGTNAKMSFGVATADAQAAVAITSQDNVGTSVAYRRHSDAACITSLVSIGTISEEAADCVFSANAFQISWSVVGVDQATFNWIALGGDIEVNLKEITSPPSTGNVSYTGVGFEPECLVGFGIGLGTSPPATFTQSRLSIGVFDGVGSSGVSVYGDHNNDTSIAKRKSGFFQSYLNTTSPTLLQQCSGWSLDADGYTLAWDTADGNSRPLWILAIRGAQFSVGSLLQPLVPGQQTQALGFTGKSAMLLTAMGASSANIENDARMGIGFFDHAGNQAFAGCVDEDNQDTTDADRIQDSDNCLLMLDHEQNVLARATGSFNGTDMILDWDVADATARESVFLVFGETTTAPVSSSSSSSMFFSSSSSSSSLLFSSESSPSSLSSAGVSSSSSSLGISSLSSESSQDITSSSSSSMGESSSSVSTFAPGLEFTVPGQRFHFSVPRQRMYFRVPSQRLHFIAPPE